MRLRAAIFDLDGTIVETSYDWPRIKADLGTGSVPILSYLEGLSEPEKSRKWNVLRRYEDEATRGAVLKEGIPDFLEFLTEKKIKKALVTNNSRKNVKTILQRFRLRFDLVLSRECGLWKPSGAPFIKVVEELGLNPSECFVVGDSLYDVRAARDAGIERIFILHEDGDKAPFLPAENFSTVAALRARIDELLLI
jgi:HAD superfamily hydrolase (TIGR01509 family)